MSEPRRGEFRGGPSEPSSFVLRGAAKREDGPPATTGLGKTAQEPRAATEGCPYTRPVRQVPGRHKDHPSDASWPLPKGLVLYVGLLNKHSCRAQSSKRSLALIQKSEANEGKPPMHV